MALLNKQDPDDEIYYAKLSDRETYELLLWRWLHFFRQNIDYAAYCEAKRECDQTACSALEKKHTRISEMYRDWDDIHALSEMYQDSPAWKDWLASKRHLFFSPWVELADPTDRPLVSEDRVLLNIPKGLKKKQVQQIIDDFLHEHPEILGDGPKYEVKRVNGMTAVDVLKRIDRADIVHDLFSSDERSHAEIAALIFKVKEVGESDMNWFRHGKESLNEISNKAVERNKLINYKREIIRLDRFYRACVEDTIHGVFPANPS